LLVFKVSFTEAAATAAAGDELSSSLSFDSFTPLAFPAGEDELAGGFVVVVVALVAAGVGGACVVVGALVDADVARGTNNKSQIRDGTNHNQQPTNLDWDKTFSLLQCQ
jgi:hypothetical protein